MNLVTDYLNPDALTECRNRIMQMSIWMQGILVGIVFLLAGCALLELLCGLQMQKYARSVTGFAVGFAVCFVILQGYTDIDEVRLLLYALAAGAVCGILNAFLERVFQFAVGFLFGTAFATWLVPEILKKDLTENPGRILRLVIAIAAGALFALLAKKLRFLLAALLGGTILGLLTESFVSYAQIPYLPEMRELSEGMYRNILPLALAGIGILIQLPQLVSRIRTERELRIPPGSADDNYFTVHDGAGQPEESGQEKTEENPTQAELNIAEAEAVLVEKARELALAASRSAEDIRLRERYEDVEQGLYSPEAAAERLGISEETFLEGMRQGGFRIPGEETPEEKAAESTEETPEENAEENTEEIPEENAEESTEEISEENTEESTGESPEENAEGSTGEYPEEEPENEAEEDLTGEPETEETDEAEDTDETDGSS